MEERLKYLFTQYLNNKCSKKEFEEFFSIIRQSSTDDTLRGLIQKVLEEAGIADKSFTYVDEYGNLVLLAPQEISITPAKNRKWVKTAAIGLSVAAVFIIAISVFLLKGRNTVVVNSGKIVAVSSLTKKVTERSEYKYMLLPDSTQVWLNAASSLEFPQTFSGKMREVFLSGEAYFDVRHAEDIPFIIHTGKVSTTVLGTAFNIKAYPGRKNVVVSVSRGKVRVSYDDKEVATLIKGQQVKVNNTDSKVVEKKSAITDAGSWQHGNMVYDEDSFEDIIADLERIYNVTIHINNPAVTELNISTSFKREAGVEGALQVLCRLTDTQLKVINGIYIIQ